MHSVLDRPGVSRLFLDGEAIARGAFEAAVTWVALDPLLPDRHLLAAIRSLVPPSGVWASLRAFESARSAGVAGGAGDDGAA